MPQPKPNLDDYANSMFRFERLHDAWIEKCAAYLKHVFGDRIAGRTVIDYAFGRGNWSIAFLRAGAKKVISIDASQSNVDRLTSYCHEKKLSNIDIICGNVMENPIDVTADILWLYGIFPAIVEQQEFADAMLKMVPGHDALIFAYCFDRHSLRACIVDCAREGVIYDTEAAFRRDSLKFTPAGRMRARDDLTAPHVQWHTAESLAALFTDSGFVPTRQVEDFRAFASGYSDAEFSAHHILLARGEEAIALTEPKRPYAEDTSIIRLLWSALKPSLNAHERTNMAISLFNTHFSHLDAKGNPEQSIIQVFLLLYYALRNAGIDATSLPPMAASMMRLADESLANVNRTSVPYADSFLVRHLQQHNIRI